MPGVRETGWLPAQSAGGIWDGGIDLPSPATPRAQMGAGLACREISGSCPFPETSNRAGVVYGAEANVLIFGLFGSCLPSQIAQAPNRGLSMIPKVLEFPWELVGWRRSLLPAISMAKESPSRFENYT